MPPYQGAKRGAPYSLENSQTYFERARINQEMAAAADLAHVRQKHAAVAGRWLDFAHRARELERQQAEA